MFNSKREREGGRDIKNESDDKDDSLVEENTKQNNSRNLKIKENNRKHSPKRSHTETHEHTNPYATLTFKRQFSWNLD